MAHNGLFSIVRRLPCRREPLSGCAVLSAVVLALVAVSAGPADARQAAAGAGASPPVVAAVDEQPPVAAAAQEISIGEPVSLPNAAPLGAAAPRQLPAGDLKPAAALESVVAPAVPGPTGPLVGLAPAPIAATNSAHAGTGWLGFAVDDALVTGRLVVVEVAPDGPAARAGMRPRDVLLSLNGTQLHTSDELAATLAALAPGQQVKMAVGRDNRLEEIVAEATTRPAAAISRPWQASPPAEAALVPPTNMVPPLAVAQATVPPSVGTGLSAAVDPPAQARLSVPAPLPAQPLAPPPVSTATPGPARPMVFQSAAPQQSMGRTALGVRTVPVDPSVQNRFHLSERSGAFVIGVVQDLPAAKAGVPPGSVIVAINHQPVRSPQDLTQLVTRGPVGTPVPLEYVLPGGAAKHADVVLQSLELPLERALVGDEPAGAATSTAEQPPRVTRRAQAGDDAGPEAVRPLERLEDLLRRMNAMNARLERIERRLDAVVSPR